MVSPSSFCSFLKPLTTVDGNTKFVHNQLDISCPQELFPSEKSVFTQKQDEFTGVHAYQIQDAKKEIKKIRADASQNMTENKRLKKLVRSTYNYWVICTVITYVLSYLIFIIGMYVGIQRLKP